MEILKKAGKIILNIFTIIVIIAIILVLYNYAQIQWFGKKYASLCGFTILEVSTGSMADTINVHDVIIVKISKDVKENDIITFEQDGMLITHRIIDITEEGIVTKGDANNAEDRMINSENIIGKVVFVCQKLGVWIKVFAEPKVFISIIITIVLIAKVFSNEKEKRRY